MGCDIYLHTEVKINGKWHHYARVWIQRNYLIFAKMANVRNYDGMVKPISLPRGLPFDVTELTNFDYKYGEADWHSESWLKAEEITELQEYIENDLDIRNIESQWGYLFGNGWDSFRKYPDSYPPGLEDIRFVFWFDN